MAGRDINIPFGPDRTGSFDLSSLVPEVEQSQPSEQQDAVDAEVSFEPDVDASDNQAPELDSTYEMEPVDSSESQEASQDDAGATHDERPRRRRLRPDEVVGSRSESAEADNQGAEKNKALADVQSSLVALKDSIGQGRELKAREKEREDFSQKLDLDREELADREDILANYDALVAEQDEIIYQTNEQREARKSELALVTAQQEETSDALERMREYHDSQLEPVESMLGRAKAAAEQAKNDERSRKSELNAAESESRRAEGGDDAAMAAAKLNVVQQAYEEAAARSEAAKEALAQAQKQYDDMKERVEQAEAPLERSIEDLTRQTDELKESINRLGDTISIARKRRQYCDTVYQYPEETDKLRESVLAGEQTVRQMDIENDELRDMLAQSKEKSKIAKLAIAGVVALVIVILIIVFVVLR